MGKNTLENEILRLYTDNLVNLFSINQIAKKLSKKYPYINKKVGMLISSGILKKIVVGRSHLCSLNLDNPKTVLALAMAELELQKKIPDIRKIKEGIAELRFRTSLLVCVYYKEKLVFVVDNIRDRREIVRAFSDSIVLDRNQFLDLMLDDPELFSSHIILYGFEKFYELLMFEIDEIKRRYSPLRY